MSYDVAVRYRTEHGGVRDSALPGMQIDRFKVGAMIDSKHHIADIADGGMSDNQPMTDLRTRIAQTLYRLYGPVLGAHPDGWDREPGGTQETYLEDADAVIAELGLEPQVHYDPDCEFYRYVTDWIDPQNNQRVDLP